nr:protein FAM57A [Onthophagus taurus]
MKPKLVVNSFLKKENKKGAQMIPLLLLCVLGSTFISLWTLFLHDNEERVSVKTGLLLSLYGGVFFTCLYSLINNVVQRTNVGYKFAKKYKLSPSDVLDTSNKIVSAVQALLSCATGVTIVCYSCPRNLLKTSHFISEGYAWFGASYFLYDIWSMYQVHCHANLYSGVGPQQNGDLKRRKIEVNNRFTTYVRNNPIIVGHHLFIGLFGFSVIVYLRGGLGDCVFGYVYLMEASTPFVSLRGILSRLGLKESKFYVVNGLLMLLVFFLCRIVMFPYVMYLYSLASGLDYLSAIASLPRGCKITMSILVLPQAYWFYLMIRGASKVLNPKSTGTSTISNRKKKNSLVSCANS